MINECNVAVGHVSGSHQQLRRGRPVKHLVGASLSLAMLSWVPLPVCDVWAVTLTHSRSHLTMTTMTSVRDRQCCTWRFAVERAVLDFCCIAI